MHSSPPLPIILLSTSARREILAARAEEGGADLRLRIGPRFEHALFFDKRTDADAVLETDGITLVLDAASAQRAGGVSIDFLTGPQGSGFKIDNPNKPDTAKQVAVRRDCEATLIPSGEKAVLPRGDSVVVTHASGNNITVRTSSGALARIAARDADAVGLPVEPSSHAGGATSGTFSLDRVFDQLKKVFDPEIPVNVIDLGLIYACEAFPLASGGHRVEIKMAMTAPGCGMGDVLKEEARARVLEAPGVEEVDVEIVWEPPWDPSRMSEAAWLQLGVL